MQSANPEAYAQRGMEQSHARLSALRGIAQDDAALQVAEDARKVAAKRLYDSALDPANQQALTPWLKGQITQLLKRPSINEASKTAQRLAMERGEKPSPNGSLRALHDVKTALDDMIASAKLANKGGEAKALSETKDQLLTVMEKLNPDYQTARQTYAQMSSPINQMQVGQAMVNKLEPALADHGALARETGEKYAQALRNADALVKSETGMARGVADVMTPDQMQTLNAVAADLARKSNAQDLGRGVGSNTFQNFAMDNLAASSGMPSAVSMLYNLIPGSSVVKGVAQKGGGMLYKSADDSMRQKMAELLLNPQAAAQVMQNTGKPTLAQLLAERASSKTGNILPEGDIYRLITAMPGYAGIALPASAQ